MSYDSTPPPPPADAAAPVAYTGELATWGKRFVGGLIDFVVIYIPGYLLYWIGAPKADADGVMSGPSVIYWIGFVYILAIGVYNRWIKGGGTGVTFGRGVAGTKLVSEATGQPIGALMAFVRDIAHVVDSLICYIGWLFPLWDAKKQTIADKLLKTVVITVAK